MATTSYTVLSEILAIVQDIEGIEASYLAVLRPTLGAGEYPAVWLRPIRWEDLDLTDDQQVLRTLTFEVAITTRADDLGDGVALEQLDQLAQAITAALDLAEIPDTIPARTLLAKGRYETSGAEETQTIEGTVSFWID